VSSRNGTAARSLSKRDGRLRVTLGGETETFDPPHGKDVDVQMLVDLRRMLRSAGTTS
jgi:hypothetical protein